MAIRHSAAYSDGVLKIQLKFNKLRYFIKNCKFFNPYIGILDRYELNCDYYDSRIEKVIGRQGGRLKQAYAVAKTKIEAARKGYSVLEKATDTGIRLHIRINQ